MEAWPPEDENIALCAMARVQAGFSVSGCNAVISGTLGIKRLFMNGDIRESDILVLTRKYIKRKAWQGQLAKDPLLYEDILKVVGTVSLNEDLIVCRNICLTVLSFFGFLRYDDAQQLKINDVEMFDKYLVIFIRQAKNDPLSEGQRVVVVANNGMADPVNIVKQYKIRMQHDDMTDEDEELCYFFPKMVKNRGGIDVKVTDNVPVGYDSLKKSVMDMLGNCGVDTSNLGLHSMRIGGATEFTRRGAKESTVVNHGRWKQPSSRLRYVRTLMDELNEISDMF